MRKDSVEPASTRFDAIRRDRSSTDSDANLMESNLLDEIAVRWR